MTSRVIEKGICYAKFKNSFYSNLKSNQSSEIIDNDFHNLENDTLNLLKNCIDPSKKNTNKLSTNLALGLIQSGKTSSMELLANLARDNGFKLIIVMSGTVGTLTKQTQSRLYKTLNGITWKRFYIPGYKDSESFSPNKIADDILSSFKTWENDLFNNNEKRTSIIVTMKNKPRLQKLLKVLKNISSKNENILNDIPALIIDDECDHASINTRRNREEDDEGGDNDEISQELSPEFCVYNHEDIDEFLQINGIEEFDLLRLNPSISNLEEIQFGMRLRISDFESATHRKIKLIRRYLPNSSYVGYTATPFVNLLINTVTNLSPNYAQVLQPGTNYTGASEFFPEDESDLFLKDILSREIANLENSNEYPNSLKTAVRFFIYGVANGIFYKDHEKNNARSMFVHTSAEVEAETGGYLSHENIIELINEDINSLKEIFKDLRENQIKINEIGELDIFNDIQNDLLKTKNFSNLELIKFNQENIKYFEKALYFIEIIEFNARNKSSIPVINWNEEGYARILVGGQGLDRGYTVEGLITSYLLRRPSIQRDTSLQRARFFGYHRKKLNLYRIFVSQISKEFFRTTINIEKHMRDSISKYLKNNKDLRLWPRIFLTESNDNYRLTNPNRTNYTMVNNKAYFQILYDSCQHQVEFNEGELENNQKIRNQLLSESQDISVLNSPRSYVGNLKHKVVTNKSLGFVYEMLKDVCFSNKGYYNFNLAFLMIDLYLKKDHRNSVIQCPIILMNDIRSDGNKMYRSVSSDDTIVIQSNRSGADYDKDKYVHYEYLTDLTKVDEFPSNIPTLQIYNFEIKFDENHSVKNVPYYVMYLPDSIFNEYQYQIGIQN